MSTYTTWLENRVSTGTVINHDQTVYNKRFIMNKEHKRTIFFMTMVNMFPPKNKRGRQHIWKQG